VVPGFSWSRQTVGRTSVSAVECIAVAARRETVEAGLGVLDEGGNAIDAAVCMAFVAAVVEPSEASIGGSGFMLLHDTGRASSWSVEFPPRAPLEARPDVFESDDDGRATGALAPCVPGVVGGLCLARERFGTLPLPRLIAPAIELAESGFAVDGYFSLQALAQLDSLRASPGAAAVFLVDGQPPVAPLASSPNPPRIRQPDLANTLRTVAADGPGAFYRGEIAAAIERAFQEEGGLITRADLRAYRATVETPLHRAYRGWSILSPRAPCGGWTVLRTLGLLERSPLAELGHGTVEGLHDMIEALRDAFVERDRLGAAGPVDSDARHGTTHLNVIDAEGRAAACTLTAGNTFGSKFVADGTGVLFDSGMSWFHRRPGAVNSIAPGKRPLVNMAPLLALSDAGPRLAVGAAGGRRIISAVTQVASAVIDHGMELQDAVSAPRLDAGERQVRLSDRLPEEVVEGLRAHGHDAVTVAEEHAPYSYELARAAAAGIDENGLRSGGIHPFATGFVAGR
jgi:gamma-glutamyltranspeptidase / glutathione hydrolase